MRVPLVMILTFGICICLSAQETPSKLPAKAMALHAEYRKALEKAQESYDDTGKQAAKEYKQELTKLLEIETKNGNLDGAITIRAEIKTLDVLPAPNLKGSPKATLKKALAGTKWNWGDAPLTLQADGQARHPVWDANKLVTRWEVADRRTVVLVIDKGRDSNRLAVLEFSETFDEFRGIDFGGGPLLGKRITGAKDK